jgi:hypothetical protein
LCQGVIVLNDHHAEASPGATKAVDEFLSDKPETVQQSTERETPAWYIVKEG